MYLIASDICDVSSSQEPQHERHDAIFSFLSSTETDNNAHVQPVARSPDHITNFSSAGTTPSAFNILNAVTTSRWMSQVMMAFLVPCNCTATVMCGLSDINSRTRKWKRTLLRVRNRPVLLVQLVQLALLPRNLLDAMAPRDANGCAGFEEVGDGLGRARGLGEEVGEGHAVLEGHAAAGAGPRQLGVGRVADEEGAALAPGREGPDLEEPPLDGLLQCLSYAHQRGVVEARSRAHADDAFDERRAVVKVGQRVLDGRIVVPWLVVRPLALVPRFGPVRDGKDAIEQLAAVDGIMQDVLLMAEMDMRDGGAVFYQRTTWTQEKGVKAHTCSPTTGMTFSIGTRARYA